MGPHQRRTKIIATIGPSSDAPDTLRALIDAGLDVARLNFSHGTHESQERVYHAVRAAELETGRPVAVMQDLSGPKIRLGKLDKPVTLEASQEAVLSAKNDFVGTAERLPTTYPNLGRDVKAGEPILLADGRLRLEVKTIDDTEVRCSVLVGGVLSSGKGLNLPGTQISAPSMTDKDRRDLAFGLKLGVDYVAMSFVRSAQDVAVVRAEMERIGRVVPIISKIEKPQAVENLEHIIQVSEGIMIARGDLGVELPAEQVPAVQRRGIQMARDRGKLTVVATQMLMSMTKHPRPTHAEVSDVANAVFDGTDCLMLSDETASGDYPVRAVEMMSALAEAAEEAPEASAPPNFVPEMRGGTAYAIARAAVATGEESHADAIVASTQRGLGPRLIAALRPPCQIIGCATTDAEVRRMAFYRGVRPLKISKPESVENLVSSVESAAKRKGFLNAGDMFVLTTKMPFVEGQETNTLKLHRLS